MNFQSNSKKKLPFSNPASQPSPDRAFNNQLSNTPSPRQQIRPKLKQKEKCCQYQQRNEYADRTQSFDRDHTEHYYCQYRLQGYDSEVKSIQKQQKAGCKHSRPTSDKGRLVLIKEITQKQKTISDLKRKLSKMNQQNIQKQNQNAKKIYELEEELSRIRGVQMQLNYETVKKKCQHQVLYQTNSNKKTILKLSEADSIRNQLNFEKSKNEKLQRQVEYYQRQLTRKPDVSLSDQKYKRRIVQLQSNIRDFDSQYEKQTRFLKEKFVELKSSNEKLLFTVSELSQQKREIQFEIQQYKTKVNQLLSENQKLRESRLITSPQIGFNQTNSQLSFKLSKRESPQKPSQEDHLRMQLSRARSKIQELAMHLQQSNQTWLIKFTEQKNKSQSKSIQLTAMMKELTRIKQQNDKILNSNEVSDLHQILNSKQKQLSDIKFKFFQQQQRLASVNEHSQMMAAQLRQLSGKLNQFKESDKVELNSKNVILQNLLNQKESISKALQFYKGNFLKNEQQLLQANTQLQFIRETFQSQQLQQQQKIIQQDSRVRLLMSNCDQLSRQKLMALQNQQGMIVSLRVAEETIAKLTLQLKQAHQVRQAKLQENSNLFMQLSSKDQEQSRLHEQILELKRLNENNMNYIRELRTLCLNQQIVEMRSTVQSLQKYKLQFQANNILVKKESTQLLIQNQKLRIQLLQLAHQLELEKQRSKINFKYDELYKKQIESLRQLATKFSCSSNEVSLTEDLFVKLTKIEQCYLKLFDKLKIG